MALARSLGALPWKIDARCRGRTKSDAGLHRMRGEPSHPGRDLQRVARSVGGIRSGRILVDKRRFIFTNKVGEKIFREMHNVDLKEGANLLNSRF